VPDNLPEFCEVISTCPLCGGKMEMAYDRPTTKVSACAECHTSVTVPASAWDVAIARGFLHPKPS
jgi:hypothetical protein